MKAWRAVWRAIWIHAVEVNSRRLDVWASIRLAAHAAFTAEEIPAEPNRSACIALIINDAEAVVVRSGGINSVKVTTHYLRART